MKLFLTSNIGAYYKENGNRIPCALDNSNGFVDHLKKYWTKQPRCLLIASDPNSFEFTDRIRYLIAPRMLYYKAHEHFIVLFAICLNEYLSQIKSKKPLT